MSDTLWREAVERGRRALNGLRYSAPPVEQSDAVVRALAALIDERGLELKPREATETMIEEGAEIQDNDCGFSIGRRAAKEVWSAMCAAFPNPLTPEEPK